MSEDAKLKPVEEEPQNQDEIFDQIVIENKKKLRIGLTIGIIIFLLLMGAVILLVIIPVKPGPGPRPVPLEENPYRITAFTYINDRYYTFILINERNKTEPDTLKGSISNSSSNFEPPYLQVEIIAFDDHMINVKIYDANNTRFNTPLMAHSNAIDDSINYFQHYSLSDLGINVQNDPFGFSITSQEPGSLPIPIFSTINKRLFFFDKYIEIVAQLQTPRIYGLTDHGSSLAMQNNKNYTLWNSHQNTPDNITSNMHNSHPFILNQLKNDKFIGIYMHNSNAMEFEMKTNSSKYTGHWRITGGIINLFIIFAADAQYIIRKYHHLIGNSYAIPFWAMGFIHSGINWNQSSELKSIADIYRKNGFPLDTFIAGMEISREQKIFTVNDNFKDLNNLISNIFHNNSMNYNLHFINTIIPSIKKDKNYNYSSFTENSSSAIKNCDRTKGLYIAKDMNNNDAYAPDFFNKDFNYIWMIGIQDLYNMTSLDGIYLKGNEPYFLPQASQNSTDILCHQYDDLPFTPVELNESLLINTRHNLTNFNILSNDTTHFNLHNLYSTQSLVITKGILDYGLPNRSFIISQSSSPSSGYFGSLIIGENPSSYEMMKKTIISMLSFNIFGISHVGSYIGGFNGSLDDQLFVRWFELGSLYPLAVIADDGSTENSRNPIKRPPKALQAARNAIVFRYSILRFYFTKIMESYLWGGASVHPLFFDFPSDENTFMSDIMDNTFMIGSTIYVTPVLNEDYETVNVYFPNWRFYNLKTYELISDYDSSKNNSSNFIDLDAPLDTCLTFIKGGTIIPLQFPNDTIINSTNDLINQPTVILVVSDHLGIASGTMIYDNNNKISPDPSSNTYRHYSLNYYNKIIRFNKIGGFNFSPISKSESFSSILIVDPVNSIDVNFACLMDYNLNVYQLEIQVNKLNNVITLTKKDSDINSNITFNSIEVIVFGNKNDDNFCQPALKVSNMDIFNNDRELMASLHTYNEQQAQINYNVIGKVLQDNLMSYQISIDKGIPNWIVDEVIDDQKRNFINSSIGFGSFGFKMANDSENFFLEFSDPNDPTNFIWTTRNLKFIYQSNFIHMKSMIKSSHIFGFGERVNNFDLPDGLYTMYSRDAISPIETGSPPGNNMYGQHPFYLFQLNDPQYYAAVLILTSNPMDVRIRHLGLVTQIDHILTGGILDMFFISKGSIGNVIHTYHNLIGKPYIIPYWAFGYHQCRWGYDSIDKLKEVIQNFSNSNLPLDVLWSDIDYMLNYQNFVLDTKRFPNMSDFISDLNKKGIQWVPILDAGISKKNDYFVYQKIEQLGCTIKSAKNGNSLIGVVWPGYVVYTDFTHPDAQIFWETNLNYLRNFSHFSGIWLDMNEVSNFCDGECSDETHYNLLGFPSNSPLMYIPGHRPLEIKALSLNAYHSKDSQGVNTPEFNLHSMYGYYSAKATNGFFMRKKERAFVLSRSTFVGSGKYTSHWLGDNYASFDFLKFSIPGIMNFNLFGIPHVGADACGFIGPFNLELCSRWYQLGAFYPFFRGHNIIGESSKEPYVDPNLSIVFSNALNIRYGLLRYIYSNYMNVARFGGLLFKPFLFDFPYDPNAYIYLNSEFIIGKAILVSPVLQPNISQQPVYFPNVNWYDFKGNRIFTKSSNKSGGIVNISASLPNDFIPWFIKEGSIITWQNASGAKNVYDMKKRKVNLLIAPFLNKTSYGSVFYDHDDWDTLITNQFHDFEISYEFKNIKFDLILNSQFEYSLQYNWDESIDRIIIFDSPDLGKIKCAITYDDRDQKYYQLQTIFDNNTLYISSNSGSNDYDLNMKYNFNISLKENCSSLLPEMVKK